MNRRQIINKMTKMLQQRYGSDYALGYMTNFLGNCLETPSEATEQAMMDRLSMVIEDCTE
jgi:hypothetical protein